MRKNKVLSILLVSSIACTAAFSAGAQDNGFYAGVGAGQSKVDEGGYDDRETAFSAFGGYDFNRYVGVEAGYADLGELKSNVGAPALQATAPYLVAVGKLPINDKFTAYAKAGINRWSLDDAVASVTGTNDDSGTDATYGLGVQYRINDKFGLRGDYSRFKVGDANVDVAQLQATYRF